MISGCDANRREGFINKVRKRRTDDDRQCRKFEYDRDEIASDGMSWIKHAGFVESCLVRTDASVSVSPLSQSHNPAESVSGVYVRVFVTAPAPRNVPTDCDVSVC